MSDPSAALLDALSDFGLEDWIPVPEAVASPEIRTTLASGETDPGSAVAQALADLVVAGTVRIYKGPTSSTTLSPIATEEALKLLAEPRWRRYGNDENEERLFFVNVANVGSEDGD